MYSSIRAMVWGCFIGRFSLATPIFTISLSVDIGAASSLVRHGLRAYLKGRSPIVFSYVARTMRPTSVARVIGMEAGLPDNPKIEVQRSSKRVQVKIGEAEALDISDDAAREFAIRIRAIADGTEESIVDTAFDYAILRDDSTVCIRAPFSRPEYWSFSPEGALAFAQMIDEAAREQ